MILSVISGCNTEPAETAPETTVAETTEITTIPETEPDTEPVTEPAPEPLPSPKGEIKVHTLQNYIKNMDLGGAAGEILTANEKNWVQKILEDDPGLFNGFLKFRGIRG